MAFQTYVTDVHHGGHFVRELVLEYVSGKVDKFEDLDLDLCSLFELRDGLRGLDITEEAPACYRIGGFDLEVRLVLVNSDQIVLQIFEVNRNHSTIDLYVGELPPIVNDADDILVGDNFGQPRDNPVVKNQVNEEDDSDSSVGTYRGEDDENEVSDSKQDSDFELFLDGDVLGDASNPIDEEEVNIGAS